MTHQANRHLRVWFARQYLVETRLSFSRLALSVEQARQVHKQGHDYLLVVQPLHDRQILAKGGLRFR